MMAMSIFSIAPISQYQPCSTVLVKNRLNPLKNVTLHTYYSTSSYIKCQVCKEEDSLPGSVGGKETTTLLKVGSPIIIIEAPKTLKTAASVPCLRANSGLVKPGDVGRIVSRKPKDVWAIRLSIGTYLIDQMYFKPLELQEEEK